MAGSGVADRTLPLAGNRMKLRFELAFLAFIALLFVTFSYAVIDTARKAHVAKEPEKMCRTIGRLEVKCP